MEKGGLSCRKTEGIRGFTLIELLITASIFGVIGVIIVTTFGSGMQVYQRVQSYGGDQADVIFSLEEMERDLRNIFPLSTIGFEANTLQISFPAMIETFEEIDGEEVAVSSIGKVDYYFDRQQEALMKSWQSYSQADNEINDNTQKSLLAYVSDVKFSFGSYDEEGDFSWGFTQDEEDSSYPAAVKVAVDYWKGTSDSQLVRTIWIPASWRAPEEEGGEEGVGL